MTKSRSLLLSAVLFTPLLGCLDGETDASEIDQSTIQNYVPITTSTTWGTGLAATGAPAAVAGSPTNLFIFARGDGSDATIKLSQWTGSSNAMAGSPSNIATDALAATFDPVTSKVFLVARTTASKLYLAESVVAANGVPGAWTWTDVGYTSVAPAVAVGCGRVQVGSTYNGQLWAWRRATSATGATGASWTQPAGFGTSVGLPAMATNANGAVGLATRGSDGKTRFSYADCGGVNDGRWSATVALGDRTTSNTRVSLGALGPLFATSLVGSDGRPYYLQQTLGLLGAQWPSTYELVEARSVIEAPTVQVFRGTVLLAGRDSAQSTRYWVRNPNTLARRSTLTMWIGGRVVGGWGTASQAPVLAASGRYSVNGPAGWNQNSAPSDLYLITRGIGDRKVYFLNFSRAIATDLLANYFKISLDTTRNPGETAATIDNVFEVFLGVLRSPTRFWPSIANVANGDHQPFVCNLDTVTGPRVYSTNGGTGGAVMVLCDTAARMEYGFQMEDWSSASRVWEELGHVTADVNKSITMTSAYTSAFNDTSYKLCRLQSDCGTGSVCRNDGVNVQHCQMSEGTWGYRPRGFALDYQTTSVDHNYIYTALMYRYHGDDMRRMVAADKAAGDTRLERKYAYVRDIIYGGVEFNGTRTLMNASATSDESLGRFALPLN